MRKKVIPNNFFKKTEDRIKQMDEAAQQARKKEQDEKAERERKNREQAEIEMRRAQELYPQTLQKSIEIFDWINRFWKDLDPTKLSLLKRLFPEYFVLFGLQVYWGHPDKLYKDYGRRYRYGPIDVRVATNPEELAKLDDPDFVTRFHDYLYEGRVWQDLESRMAKKIDELSKHS